MGVRVLTSVEPSYDAWYQNLVQDRFSEPIDNTVESLREAVWRFVERHQHEKLEKHVRRGNLNGLPNFLDIFRTLNGLLITFNKRTVKGVPVIRRSWKGIGAA